MNSKGIRPEDILLEDENYTIISGIKVRKGTIAAALQNTRILSSPSTSQSEKKAAKEVIIELAPALVVLDMYEHVIWKNPEVQEIVEKAAKKLEKR